jgi:N-acetyllactosaminide alpha-2,3-sialyltransferase
MTNKEVKAYLVLVRTPFQAWLVEKVIRAEGVSEFDLLYFTQDDSSEDRHYFGVLAQRARMARYVYVSRKSRSIINYLCFAILSWPFVFRKKYKGTLVSSIDSYVLNSIAVRAKGGAIVSFDDGTANYNKDGAYFVDEASWKVVLFRFLFRSKSPVETKRRIRRHYTIHPYLDNIVDARRVRAIPGWGAKRNEAGKLGVRTYFIGAPFEEILSKKQIRSLRSHLKNLKIDFYVSHPREQHRLCLDIPLLEKSGQIAEEAILKDASEYAIVLVGFLSSVMFNLESCAARRLVLIPGEGHRYSELTALAEKSGCEIINFE